MRAQPAVYRGRVILGGPDGTVVALDAKTGCTHWQAKAAAQIRTGAAVAVVGGRALAYLGDTAGFLNAFDAETGAPVWKRRIDDHATALATATPVFHAGRIYVGAASYEESSAARPDYVCCTFRGSVSALDAATGTVLWKTWTIPDPPKPQPDNKRGHKVMGPSGVGVWAAPTIDAAHGLLYVATGDNYTEPATPLSDAVLALSMADGRIVWSKQLTAGDAFNVGCGAGPNCPDAPGPDYDLGDSPMLVTASTGRRLLVVGQKSGQLHALDPDRQGDRVWTTRVGKGSALGGIQWGPATDGKQVYAAVSDIAFTRQGLDPEKGGGISGIRVDNGEIVWKTPNPGCGDRRPCSPAQSAAVTASNGFVFSGALDGHLRAYDTTTGKILWDFDAARDFPAVNAVKGNGGAFDAGGPVLADGMVFATSGYAQWGSLGGNVLLAFAVEP
jgi:polyvinyl alcohol dehydrogenase (cytochrome)